jgi:FixJ family two-component response regulator
MVLDLQLQDGTGNRRLPRGSIGQSLGQRPCCLTSSGDDEALVSAILAGAAGYIVKLTRTGDIVAAIRRVATGKSLIDPATAERVTRQILAGMDEFRPPLSDYERELITQVAYGLTNDQVAQRRRMRARGLELATGSAALLLVAGMLLGPLRALLGTQALEPVALASAVLAAVVPGLLVRFVVNRDRSRTLRPEGPR